MHILFCSSFTWRYRKIKNPMHKTADWYIQQIREINTVSKGNFKRQAKQIWNYWRQPIRVQHLQNQQSGWKAKNHRCASSLAIVGRYVLTPDIFDKIKETEPGVDGEIQLTDALTKLDEVYGYSLKVKHITLQPVLIGLRLQLNLVLRIPQGMNWFNIWKLSLYVFATSNIFYFVFWLD